MSDRSIRIKCPAVYPAAGPGKIQAIKTIRTITGCGLKEAKDYSEITHDQTLFLDQAWLNMQLNVDAALEAELRILRSSGIEVCDPVYKILESLRELGAQALRQGEDELANEILQLVLAEKLRRKP